MQQTFSADSSLLSWALTRCYEPSLLWNTWFSP